LEDLLKEERKKGRESLFGWVGALLLYGVLTQLLLVRLIAHWMYPERPESFAHLVATQLAIAVPGGIFFCLSLWGLLKKIRGTDVAFRRLLFSAGLRCMASTALAFELFYLLLSAYLTIFQSGEPRLTVVSQHLGVFVLWFIEIQTFGIAPIVMAIPFSFLLGALAGLWVLRLTRPNLATA